jgi:hypothetical protein
MLSNIGINLVDRCYGHAWFEVIKIIAAGIGIDLVNGCYRPGDVCSLASFPETHTSVPVELVNGGFAEKT